MFKNVGIFISGDFGIGYFIMEGYWFFFLMFNEGEVVVFLIVEKFIGKFMDKEM